MGGGVFEGKPGRGELRRPGAGFDGQFARAGQETFRGVVSDQRRIVADLGAGGMHKGARGVSMDRRSPGHVHLARQSVSHQRVGEGELALGLGKQADVERRCKSGKRVATVGPVGRDQGRECEVDPEDCRDAEQLLCGRG